MNVLVVFGTRPELIKLAPVVRAMRQSPSVFDVRICTTAQHRDLLDPLLALFDIRPDVDLDVMRTDQSPAEVVARVISGLAPVLSPARSSERDAWAPDWVIVQGDTTTTMSAALAARYAGVRIAHVEAGLRTGRLDQPFPEEANRRIVGAIADLHFAPTPGARDHLRAEGVPDSAIAVTGNSGIDALLWAASQPAPDEATWLTAGAPRDVILVTAHRRESFGAPLEQICLGVCDVAERFGPAVRVIYPVHPNPNVDGPVRRLLGHVPNVRLVPPLGYVTLVHLLKRSRFVLTDSGGLQEEAPSLGKPVLVLRETTERPEGVAAGTARVVGADRARILTEASRLLEDAAAYARMARAVNPYGDGRAADRIVAALMTPGIVFPRNSTGRNMVPGVISG
jgi:UDP-N-acetylglucosamine 2-epimerase (non-hydrolysing)